MSTRSPLLITRRVAVGAALLGAGGCTFDSGGRRGSIPRGSPEVSDAEFDLGLLDEARVELAAMLDLVRRTSLKHVGLASALTALADLHEAHDSLLADSVAEPSPPATIVPVPRHRARALQLVRTREVALQGEFANLALRARSGRLARVLASMSAAVGQYVVQLSRVNP